MRLRVGHQQSQFRPILARFVDYCTLFWGPEVISMIDEPRGAFMSRFVDYYSLFRGPKVISTIDEPRGAFKCRSSTLTILADPGMFRALLLTVLGCESDFHD